MGREFSVAVVGATGAVGEEMRKILLERNFPIKDIRFFALEKGLKLRFGDSDVVVEELREGCFRGVEIALFSAGADVSKEFAPKAVQDGAIVIDNSSAFRMDPNTPLVVPEVNPHALLNHKGLIANPNCSTIQMVVVLKPLHDAAKIKRVVVSTYQSVSGTGAGAIRELWEQSKAFLNEGEIVKRVYPHRIAFNCLPHIDTFLDSGYTKEEMKMVNETRKIMEDETLSITATAVRVPVFRSHSESVNIETERKLSREEVREILSHAPGVVVVDEPEKANYPLPIDAEGKDETFVGRIREDESIPNGINMWIVSDNLRKGAALNAIQIAELLIKGNA
jgi:aspartate-semialdehyde dehydrogenase